LNRPPRAVVAGLEQAHSAPTARASHGAARARVLIIQTQAENAGAQEISRILSKAMAERGYDVHQLFLFRRTEAFDAAPNTVFCAETRPDGLLSLVRLLVRLVRELRRLRPDAVLTFQHYGNLIGAAAARLAGVPFVVANQTSATRVTPPLARRLDRLLGAAGLFDRIVVNSRDAAAEYQDYHDRYRHRLAFIPHGFEDKTSPLGKADARRRFGLPVSAVLLGCVARLHPLKNLEAAVRLLPLDAEWHLVLAGQGPSQPGLAELATSLGCADRLHFVGEVSSAQVGEILAALDVFVFPSLAETFGLAAVEAAQAGVPVVANGLDVLREVLAIEGEACAVFVDPANTHAFAKAVRGVLADPRLAQTLTERGRKLRQRYSLNDMVEAYEALLASGSGSLHAGERP
jgi:glycosyltransferase involved in cell wall biosynthesis